MKYQKGFVNIVLIGAVILLVAIGGYFAWYKKSNNVDTALPSSSVTSQADTANWKTYTNTQYGFEFKYPENLKLTETDSKINLNHSIPYKNNGDCDMVGGNITYSTLTDFNLSFEITPKVKLSFKDGEYSKGELKGEWVIDGAEGCGTSNYYFPYDSQTLTVKRNNIQVLANFINNPEQKKEILAIPGAISSEENQIIFDKILSTFKFTKPNTSL